ncbi:MAG: sulfite exporter TauE/SafE family protein, partial [Anaerolineae bacterium]|nr:sulfite exporter TauE/SafE family protein [Anaerolineae bacterium]
GEKSFRILVPYFILFATLILAFSDRLKRWLVSRSLSTATTIQNTSTNEALRGSPAIFLSAIYGGYFGAGLGVIVLSALGLIHNDSLTRLNVIKQAISFAVNVTAAIFFIFSGQVNWPVVAVMAFFAWLGGVVGGRMASNINPTVLRWIVVCIGLAVSVIYFIKG